MNDKNKLLALIKYFCFSNNAEFAREIGISPQALNNWLSRGWSKDAPQIIVKAFPSVNTNWLLTGEGDMLKPDSHNDTEVSTKEDRGEPERAMADGKVTYIPLIHIDSVGGVHSPNSLTNSEQYVERMIPFPDARPGDVAILQSGNSMAPTIPAGAILQIRKVENWREYFGYGGDFVLWLTDERRITKQVLKYEPDPKNYVTCHSYNPEAADEELPKSMIQEVWKVVNVLINKGW